MADICHLIFLLLIHCSSQKGSAKIFISLKFVTLHYTVKSVCFRIVQFNNKYAIQDENL